MACNQLNLNIELGEQLALKILPILYRNRGIGIENPFTNGLVDFIQTKIYIILPQLVILQNLIRIHFLVSDLSFLHESADIDNVNQLTSRL